MLDINFVRENQPQVKTALAKRGLKAEVLVRVLKIDETRRQLIVEIEEWRRRRNQLSRDEVEKGKQIKGMLRRLEPDLKAVEEELKLVLGQIPNLPAEDVPEGEGEAGNVEIKKWAEPKKFEFKPKDHLDLGESLGIIDVKRAAKVSGSRFGYLKDRGALLEFALINFGLKFLTRKGFRPIIPPVINKKEVEWGLGYSEGGGWDQTYLFEKDNLVFTSSSEHTIIPQHMDETFPEKELEKPLRYIGFSSCFRREAGTYGKDTRGIFRVHQFDKLEMNVFTLPDPEISDKECLHLLSLQEEMIQVLELPYRIVHCGAGDLPHPNRRMYDLEVWFPGQERYREVSSCSNCADYQARRLNIKVKTKTGLQFVHTLNATGLAIGRIIAALLENHQQKDGSVMIPKKLQEFTDFTRIAG